MRNPPLTDSEEDYLIAVCWLEGGESLTLTFRMVESKSVTHVAMASTGIYWKPVYDILEGYFDVITDGFHVLKHWI